MNEYRMQVQSSIGGLSWEFPFHMASDEMAIAFAERYVRQWAHVRWFVSLIVWRMKDQEPLVELGTEEVINVRRIKRR